MKNKIIYAAPNRNEENYAMATLKRRIERISIGFFNSASRIVNAINSGAYQGMYISDLCLPLGKDFTKYEIRLTQEEAEAENGAGLVIVRYAIEKGLPTIVRTLTTTEAKQVKNLGAVVSSSITETERLFQKLFLEIARTKK